jgi:ElaA protein
MQWRRPRSDENTTTERFSMIDWQWCELGDLSTRQLYAVLAAREAVFVVEQHCAYQELDGLDLGARHLIGWSDGEVAAYLRVLGPGIRFAEPSIGRVLTSRAARGTGVGRELVARSLAHVDERYADHGLRISAQAHLQRFYGSFGFDVASPPYLEDGIPHIEMLRVQRCS